MAMTSTPITYSMGNEVIRSFIDTVKGGVVLDTTGFTEENIQAGHIIIRDVATQKTYKPMPVSSGAYESLPGGYEYVGVNIYTTPTDEPLVSVLTIGEVNEALVPFSIASIKAAFKAAVPTINWAKD